MNALSFLINHHINLMSDLRFHKDWCVASDSKGGRLEHILGKFISPELLIKIIFIYGRS
jgi:hypothetical protein